MTATTTGAFTLSIHIGIGDREPREIATTDVSMPIKFEPGERNGDTYHVTVRPPEDSDIRAEIARALRQAADEILTYENGAF